MRIGSIVFGCYEFDKMLAFWQEALHYVYVPKEPPKDGWVILRDPEGRGPNVSRLTVGGHVRRYHFRLRRA